MTIIQQESATFFTLTTAKGKAVGVSVQATWLSVYIQQNGTSRLSLGRHFHHHQARVEDMNAADVVDQLFTDAMAAYRSADVKAALAALHQDLAARR